MSKQPESKGTVDPSFVIRHSSFAWLALGSNLGNSILTVRAAFEQLQKFSAAPLLKSSLWQSAPVDCPPGSPLFVNAAAGLEPLPGETPESLLSKLQELERFFGRQPKQILNEPRALDLDLIAFGSEIRSSQTLILPHPRAHLRAFVLEPLCEIAPNLILPAQRQTIRELLSTLSEPDRPQRLA